MPTLSTSERKLLNLAYKNYLENHSLEYTFRMTSGNDVLMVNTLRSFAERGIIEPISDNFYSGIISPVERYIFRLTDAGINLAETSGL